MAGLKDLITILLVCSLANIGETKYKMVCYYTNWSQYRNGVGKFFPPDIDPHLCTHIVYAFGKLVGNKITNFEWNDNDEYNNLYKQVNDLKMKNPALKTLLAMGGWTAGSLAYSNMASTFENRKEFIESSISWLRKYDFDGLDMDWEYPANRDGKPYDKENFALLCKETREAFNNEAAATGKDRLLFTSAVGAGRSVIDSAYDVPAMAEYMDFICLMTYDLHGSWESVTGLHAGLYASNNDPDKTLNVASAAEYWHQKGAPREKLIIGLATYGRSFTLVDSSQHGVGAPVSGAGLAGPYTREKGVLSYYEICEMQRSGQGVTYRDPVAKVPYFVNPNTKLWVGFDDEASLLAKLTELIIKDGYGGAMTWSLPLDDFTGTICGEGKYPLISLMKKTLDDASGGGPVNPPSTNSPVTDSPTAAPTNAPSTNAPPTNAPPTKAPVTTQAPVVTTESGGGSESVCAQASNGFVFPNANECTSFYQCVHGKAVKISCQPGLYFNVKTSNCDWPSNVDCSLIVTTHAPVTSATTTSSPKTTAPATLAPTTLAPTTLAPTTIAHTSTTPTKSPTTPTPTGSGFCSTASNGLHPHPHNCSLYYNCWGGIGDPLPCPAGQYFSTKYNGCDYASNVECSNQPTNAPVTEGPVTNAPTQTPAPTTRAPTQAPETQAPAVSCADGALYLAHPTDCAKFYQCNHGDAIEMSCQSGLFFSLKHSTCVWPEGSECEP
uniref:Acidic mammalian chitinase-like isoform X2 n=1 Tax=Crassostrea virginica TaxID=6565 RepID=A0A8B8CKC7_CRAVI|nr:acidic mammalian chitinase-like isoform X2 [Crassostrea virginica]